MDGLDAMFDGIIAQQAGELLLDEPQSTRLLRRLCPRSYLRSLEDFAFAAIFSGKIVTTQELADVLGGHPGEKLLTKYFSDKHDRRLLEGTAAGWESLLDDTRRDDRETIRGLIGSLELMITGRESGVFWRELIVREVMQYFGKDESLTRPNAGSEYQFFRRGNFRRDEDLQSTVPPKYLEIILEEVKTKTNFHAGVKIAHDDAIREFAARNALAHVGMFHWYCRFGEKALRANRGARIPYATRQSFPVLQSALWRFKSLVVPGLLHRMIEKSRNRDELRDQLVVASMDSTFQPIREKLAGAWRLLEDQEQSQELDSLVFDIEREVEAWKHPETRHIVFSTAGTQYERAVKMLVWRGAGVANALTDYAKVFPELCDTGTPDQFDVL